ncbi:hypothetical protein ABT369_43775 [Dactylosporangium sp. NPDC000244]|uniref:hypothetical protein n=1 Tax=Dactylosporangium sp. NPDC000244 TaxID=3154365 RepID=UPI003329424C
MRPDHPRSTLTPTIPCLPAARLLTLPAARRSPAPLSARTTCTLDFTSAAAHTPAPAAPALAPAAPAHVLALGAATPAAATPAHVLALGAATPVPALAAAPPAAERPGPRSEPEIADPGLARLVPVVRVLAAPGSLLPARAWCSLDMTGPSPAPAPLAHGLTFPPASLLSAPAARTPALSGRTWCSLAVAAPCPPPISATFQPATKASAAPVSARGLAISPAPWLLVPAGPAPELPARTSCSLDVVDPVAELLPSDWGIKGVYPVLVAPVVASGRAGLSARVSCELVPPPAPAEVAARVRLLLPLAATAEPHAPVDARPPVSVANGFAPPVSMANGSVANGSVAEPVAAGDVRREHENAGESVAAGGPRESTAEPVPGLRDRGRNGGRGQWRRFGGRAKELAGVVVAVLVALVMGGCGVGGEQPGSTSAAASTDPAGKDALVGAVKALQGTTYGYTMKIDNGTVTGVVDPTGKRQARLDSVASGVKFSLEGIVLGGGERYFRTSIPAAGVSSKKWYRFDRTKVTRTEIIGLFETKDPTSSQDFVARVARARLEDGGKITGTYDLTRGGDLGLADQAGLTALGERAKAVPFVVTLDAQGRLASVRVTVPAYAGAAERTLTVDYRDQGKPAQVTVPKAAEVAPANAAVYNLLNN